MSSKAQLPSRGNRRRKRNKPRKEARYPRDNNSFRLTVPVSQKGAGYLEPSQRVQTLRFMRKFTITAAAASQAKRFMTNDIYRPDPASFAQPAIGFVEYQTMYSLFRVIEYHYVLEVFNNEAFPVALYVLNSNQDPSVSASLTDTGQDNVQRRTISAKGGLDKVIVRKRYRIVDIVGSETVEFDDDYRGTMSAGSEASPADKTWMAIGAESGNGSNLTNGVTCFLWLFYKTRLYDREFMAQGAVSSVYGSPLVPLPQHELEYFGKKGTSKSHCN